MRYGFFIGLVLLLGFATGCSDDDDGGGVVVVPATFTASTTAAAPDGVRLAGSAVSETVINVQVVLDGITASTDLYAFAFDIELSDPSVIQFVPGSAMFGDVLETTGGQGEAVIVSQQGNRVIVGVSKTAQGLGNGIVLAEERLVVSMDFSVTSGTTSLTFADSPNNPQNPTNSPTALDSNLAAVGTIIFDPLSATITR